jgi:Uma2 family endonuclease
VSNDPQSRILYWRAGIPEYWLVDARGDRLYFEIYRLTPEGYVATRRQSSWARSRVFGKSFRLTRRKDELGNPEFTLSVR